MKQLLSLRAQYSHYLCVAAVAGLAYIVVVPNLQRYGMLAAAMLTLLLVALVRSSYQVGHENGEAELQELFGDAEAVVRRSAQGALDGHLDTVKLPRKRLWARGGLTTFFAFAVASRMLVVMFAPQPTANAIYTLTFYVDITALGFNAEWFALYAGYRRAGRTLRRAVDQRIPSVTA